MPTGRKGRVSGTYEKVVGGLPYIIAYARRRRSPASRHDHHPACHSRRARVAGRELARVTRGGEHGKKSERRHAELASLPSIDAAAHGPFGAMLRGSWCSGSGRRVAGPGSTSQRRQAGCAVGRKLSLINASTPSNSSIDRFLLLAMITPLRPADHRYSRRPRSRLRSMNGPAAGKFDSVSPACRRAKHAAAASRLHSSRRYHADRPGFGIAFDAATPAIRVAGRPQHRSSLDLWPIPENGHPLGHRLGTIPTRSCSLLC